MLLFFWRAQGIAKVLGVVAHRMSEGFCKGFMVPGSSRVWWRYMAVIIFIVFWACDYQHVSLRVSSITWRTYSVPWIELPNTKFSLREELHISSPKKNVQFFQIHTHFSCKKSLQLLKFISWDFLQKFSIEYV